MSGPSDSDMNVSFEDQQKINKFARHNARLDDIIEELKAKEHELQALEDAESDLMMTEMASVPCRIGDVLIFMTRDEAQDVIEKKKENVAVEKKELCNQQDTLKQMMSDLKVQLYAKFGNNINLEPE